MIKNSRMYGRFLILVIAAFILIGSACSQEQKERTRQGDNVILRELVAHIETWTTERDPGAFAGQITESFDAAAFIDAMWAGVEAERVVFKVRRLRTSDNRSRAVIDVAFMTGESMVAGQYVVVEMIFVEGIWKADSYQLFGPDRK